MRIGKVALLALTGAALFACTNSTSPGALSFTIAESLFVFQSDQSDAGGYALLSSAVGNCPALQRGLQPVEIGSTNYLLIIFEQLDAQGNWAPVTAGTYNVLDLSSSTGPTPPALFAYSSVVQTDSACSFGGSGATGGSATLSPLNTADGGISSLTYSIDYSGTQLTGTYQLTTCLVPVLAPDLDGGCAACVGPGDGGPCTVQ